MDRYIQAKEEREREAHLSLLHMSYCCSKATLTGSTFLFTCVATLLLAELCAPLTSAFPVGTSSRDISPSIGRRSIFRFSPAVIPLVNLKDRASDSRKMGKQTEG